MTDNEVQNGPPEDQPQEKTAKQLEKEAKKAAKLEKLKAKLDKKSATPAVQKDKPEVRTLTIFKIWNHSHLLLNLSNKYYKKITENHNKFLNY